MPMRLFLLFVLALFPVATVLGDPVDADILLTGGKILDGTGADPAVGDVAIKGDRIIAVGKFEVGTIPLVLDCAGLYIAPGFIDLHNHSDRQVVQPGTRGNVNYLLQGCTTVVTGNCGFGPVNVGEYYDKINAAGAGTNVIHLLAQGSLRDQVMGSANRAPTGKDLRKMRQLTRKAMQDGAWGMSTGLIYVPGAYTKTEELIQIARVVAQHDGIYASHMRNEGIELLNSVNETVRIGREAGLPVHISHFKSSGIRAWGLIRRAVELIEQARKTGQVVTADQYPYIASSTSLGAMLIPTWARAGGRQELLKRLGDPEQSKRIRDYISEGLERRGDRAPIRIGRYKPKPAWIGKSVLEIATAEKRDPVDVVVEIARQGGAGAVSFSMTEEDVRFAMKQPWVATASDGRAYLPNADRPHPRSYGTFPRKIGYYALKEKVLSLPHAVRSASGLPADILGLKNRGYVKPDTIADLVVFDPRSFRDRATFDKPHQYSTGAKYVFVAGKPAVFDFVPTGALAGRALKRQEHKRTSSSN